MGTLNQTLAKSEAKQKPVALSSANSISASEVHQALKAWGDGLTAIAKTYAEKGNYREIAAEIIHNSYAYGSEEVLFKPTLASKVMFRKTFDSALSYFVGGNKDYAEDSGFALNPWVNVEFDIAGIKTGEKHALVMGNKLLTKKDGTTTVANFTMGFTLVKDGTLKINLHHSSLPYSPV
jgi:hypothetical protein